MAIVTVFNPRGYFIDGLSDQRMALGQPTMAHSPQGNGKHTVRVNVTPTVLADGRVIYSTSGNGV